MIEALDLFCGAGGASLGIEAAGVRVAMAIDSDPKAFVAHGHLLPNGSELLADLNVLDPNLLPDVPLWWASPPCQPGSTAGLRGGKLDPRDGYPALLRLVRARRPTWLVIENVPGFLQHRAKASCGALFPKPEECPACYLDAINAELRKLFPDVDGDLPPPVLRYRRIRTLTVAERAILQSLPPHPILTGKLVGNAVPPPLATAVIRAVLDAHVRCR